MTEDKPRRKEDRKMLAVPPDVHIFVLGWAHMLSERQGGKRVSVGDALRDLKERVNA
jgi:hypothetical protein